MRNFSIRCKAKYLVAAVLAAACDPGDDGDESSETSSETSTGDSDSVGDGDGDADSTGGDGSGDDASDSGVPPDMGTSDTCPSLCPGTTTLECGEGERCVPTPTHPECQPCP